MRGVWRLGDRVLVTEKGHVDRLGVDVYGHNGDLVGFGNGHARVRFPAGEVAIPYDDLRNVQKRPKKEDGHTPSGATRPIGVQIAERQGRKRR